jgi:hypothetical protein
MDDWPDFSPLKPSWFLRATSGEARSPTCLAKFQSIPRIGRMGSQFRSRLLRRLSDSTGRYDFFPFRHQEPCLRPDLRRRPCGGSTLKRRLHAPEKARDTAIPPLFSTLLDDHFDDLSRNVRIPGVRMDPNIDHARCAHIPRSSSCTFSSPASYAAERDAHSRSVS